MSGRPIFDAIVVGSGAAGSWAAKELTEKGMRVLLLEAGRAIHPERDFPAHVPSDRGLLSRIHAALRGQHIQCRCTSFSLRTRDFYVNDRQNPYETPPGKPYYWFRGRQLGGRLHTWVRGALRMSDHEFKAASRDGYGEDWPISYGDLAPYYERVERFLGVHGDRDGIPNVPDGTFIPPIPPTPMEGALRMILHEKCPEREPVAARLVRHNPLRIPLPILAAQKTGRLVIRTDAVVSHITLDENTGKAKGVIYIDRLSKKPSEALGNVIVLCASTIESIRILLNSACKKHPAGIGNSSGVLGHYLVDHVMVLKVGVVDSKLCDRNPVAPHGGRDPYDFGNVGLYFPSFRNVKERCQKFLRGYAMSCRVGMGEPSWWLLSFGEMLPRFENSISLHPTKKDALGIPVAKIACVHSSNERAMIADMHETMNEIIELGGLRIQRMEEFCSFNRIVYRLLRSRVFTREGAFYPGASIHEAGGARMGLDPKVSVLNRYNQCWDVKNLFVTDGAGFVSSGFQNITLTIMALTARACDYIVDEYRRGNL